MELATMTTKGQVTLPVALRRSLGLDTGDRVIFYEYGGRTIIERMSPEALERASQAALKERILSVEEIADLCRPVAESNDLKRITLFGSCARGEAQSNSDVDLFIETDEPMSFFKLGGLLEVFKAALHKEVDLLTEGSLTEALREEIRKDGRVIYEYISA